MMFRQHFTILSFFNALRNVESKVFHVLFQGACTVVLFYLVKKIIGSLWTLWDSFHPGPSLQPMFGVPLLWLRIKFGLELISDYFESQTMKDHFIIIIELKVRKHVFV